MIDKTWYGAAFVGLAACAAHGDGGARDGAVAADGSTLVGSAPTATSERAVRAVLAQHAACQASKPFYWEIGGPAGAALRGSEGVGYTQSTQLEIASASKWMYTAYYLQVGSSRVDLQACKLEYSIVSPK